MPVKAIGADKVEQQFNRLNLDLPNLQQRFLDEISKTTIELLKQNTPKDTGILANSWYESARTNNYIIITTKDSTPAKYKANNNEKLRYVLYGTRPHTILPKEAQALKFEYPKGSGEYVFAKKVNHPGTQPNNFLASVLYAISLNIDAVMRRLMKQSHPYYSNIGVGTLHGYTITGARSKWIRTSSNIGGLTGNSYRQKGARKYMSIRKTNYGQRITGRARTRPRRPRIS